MTRISEQEYARIIRYQKRPEKGMSPTPTEHVEQCIVINWAQVMVHKWPELRLLAAIPNGGERDIVTAQKLKAEGVLAGMPDLILCAQRGGYGALFVELKRADHSNHPTPMQAAIHKLLQAQGYSVCVAYGADQAIEAIEQYLGMS